MRGAILLAEQRKLVSVQCKALQTGQKQNRTSSPVVAFTGVCWKIQDLPFLKGRRNDQSWKRHWDWYVSL